MNLGDVSNQTVPKMSLLAPAQNGGLVSTRTFIPHRVHESIGVLGAVSVATACMLPGSVAHRIAVVERAERVETAVVARAERVETPVSNRLEREVVVEHPTGFFTVTMEVDTSSGTPEVTKSALLRTARLLMRGDVYVPASLLETA